MSVHEENRDQTQDGTAEDVMDEIRALGITWDEWRRFWGAHEPIRGYGIGINTPGRRSQPDELSEACHAALVEKGYPIGHHRRAAAEAAGIDRPFGATILNDGQFDLIVPSWAAAAIGETEERSA